MTVIPKSRQTGIGLIGALAVLLGTVVVTLTLMSLSYGEGQPSDNNLSLAVVIHLATVVPAVPLGGYVLLRRKGDSLHRILGRVWVVLMLVTAISSFWLSLSFIHIFSVLVLVSVPLSLWRISKGDVVGHRRSMEGMYIGLVVAGAFAFIPGRLLGTLLFG
ncbi:DUF2306 domain-containing protein [Parasphingopyxis lamellibrachiae]|uniref:Putative membrane protein n=1 Tax=Parasphingopyxis lamellibrachiae TaxID=680125 RepID=A0A3D9FJ64_9SPHN|nr:DUF2306 domain-containing protein [Parasphingopyxis lamellibrachiae]RED17141.1 putative membrane protein [Parasphingopyxis lamellibrachiae]